MKHKSLRQLARELGVSASYLSQVKNGKRPASQKVLSSLDGNLLNTLGTVPTQPEEGFEPISLPITSRLRYHCATRASTNITIRSQWVTKVL